MSKNSVPFHHPWKEDLIGNIGSITVGGTPRTSVDKYWNGDVPWMTSGDVHLRKVTDVPSRITELGLRYSNATMVDPPTVAIGLAGQGRTRGTAALVICRLCTNQSVALIKADGEVLETRYLLYELEFRYEELRSRSAGGGRAGLSKQLLEQVPIPLPNLSEQTKIAEILSTLDQAIEQTEALIAKQQRIKTGLMQDLLTRGIDEHGNLRSEETHPFKDSPMGRIPVEWEAASVSSVLGEAPKNGYSPVESGVWNGIYMLGLGCLTTEGFKPIQLKYAPKTDRRIESALLMQGDFLISRSNTRALVGIVGIFRDVGEPCIYPDLMVRLQFSAEVSTDYMEQVFMSPPTRRQIENVATGTSGSMVKISAAVIKSLLFSKPPLEEQLAILSILQAKAEGIRRMKAYLDKLRSLKTALMQDLLTGNKRVTEILERDPRRSKRE
ncbi:MAG: restriction endonuclease subunit S [Bacilli bacterium]